MSLHSTRTDFGPLPDGSTAGLFTLQWEDGLRVAITDLGGTVVSLFAPDARGVWADVVLGHDSPAAYLASQSYFGCLIGRVANRTALGEFTLDGTTHSLETNNGPNHLHGGEPGFHKVLWNATLRGDGRCPALALSRLSPHGEASYSGNLQVDVQYSLPEKDTLRIDYRAETDRATPVNLTNHSYFNLRGHDAGSILDHEITIAATGVTPVDASLIPTGEILAPGGTAFDFAQRRRIGDRINDPALRLARGYDHNYVLAKAASDLRSVALLAEPISGRTIEVLTTEPCMQFYSGNFLDGTETGKGGAVYAHRTGLCLETQRFPDAPNQPRFPDITLRPGQVFRSTTLYRFGLL